MSTVIKVENVSKVYQLGTIGTGTLSHDLNRWWARIRGKEDPTMQLGQENKLDDSGKTGSVLALKDISFQVEQGTVLGIIGKNGAGKSTLLKILSKVTAPTTGSLKIKGRVASLLEVGTGFHPELSGRENIFLNGAIMGMTKAEVRAKFDEIIDFSGVEKYIETPVKRYSSGMYVRLAFAVAAHLDPEILIIDEVLAVGDAEFQKKCIGKIRDVSSSQGRTVLFVSHNMSAVNSLCKRCLYMSKGKLALIGDTGGVVQQYLTNETANTSSVIWETNKPGDEIAILHSARLIDENHNTVNHTPIDKKIGIEFTYEVIKEGYCPNPNLCLSTIKGDCVFASGEKQQERLSKKGIYKTTTWIPGNFLNNDIYTITLALTSLNPVHHHFWIENILSFEVIENTNLRNSEYNQKIAGIIRPLFDWNTIMK